MTDERIKEEYDVWISDVECTENERRFFSQYPEIDIPPAIGFYAGFRTAERLAKIEAADRFCASCPGKEDGMRVQCSDRDAILSTVKDSLTVSHASTDAEKLAIAVKALEEIQKHGTYNTLEGRTLSGERVDSKTIINEYGIIAREALKEIE